MASEHAVVGLTKSAALYLDDNKIRVTCICPIIVNTPRTANTYWRPREQAIP